MLSLLLIKCCTFNLKISYLARGLYEMLLPIHKSSKAVTLPRNEKSKLKKSGKKFLEAHYYDALDYFF